LFVSWFEVVEVYDHFAYSSLKLLERELFHGFLG